MKAFGNLSMGQMIIPAIVGYGGATYFSYKYNDITKAQDDLRNIQDKRVYLLDIH